MKLFHTIVLSLSITNVIAQADCGFFRPVSERNIFCGYVEVPQDHKNPKGKKIRIAYAILKAKNVNTKESPVILLNGGPGGQALIGIERWINNPIRNERDLIVFDQRGIGSSSALPNPDMGIFKILAGNHSIQDECRLMFDTLAMYKRKSIAQQIELDCYITEQNAADVNALMEKLGYIKYVLYGESYGTRLARVVMERFPSRINCVIADAPAILEDDFLSLRIKNFNDVMEKIFVYCENDAASKANYPNLRNDYVVAVRALENNPLKLRIGGQPFFVNPQDALFMLRYQSYAGNSKTAVPAFIAALKVRDTVKLNASQQFLIGFVNSMNLAMFLSTERNEEYDANRDSSSIDSLYATLPNLPAQLGFFTSLYKAGVKWHSKTLTNAEKKLRKSSIPTLIFVNKFDPVTPPKNGDIFKESLTHAKLYILDLEGHGVSGDCVTQVMIDFMNNPKTELGNANYLPTLK